MKTKDIDNYLQFEDKWFKFYKYDIWEGFKSKKKAKTVKDAWEKTLTKWALIKRGLLVPDGDQALTCGLCDKYNICDCTHDCPLAKYTGEKNCTSNSFLAYEKFWYSWIYSRSKQAPLGYKKAVNNFIKVLCATYSYSYDKKEDI